MSQFPTEYKENLLQDLWLPKVKYYGRIFQPRRKNNKRLKILSLTSNTNFIEISEFLNSKIALREDVLLWTYDLYRKLCLESEGFQVLHPSRYEDVVIKSPVVISNHFPFSIINLDFVSQELTTEHRRVELEIESVEATFSLQRNSQPDLTQGFVLLYTTYVDNIPIDVECLIDKLNSYHRSRWNDLDTSTYTASAITFEDKIHTIEKIFKEIAAKYEYRLLDYDHKVIENILSITLAVKRCDR